MNSFSFRKKNIYPRLARSIQVPVRVAIERFGKAKLFPSRVSQPSYPSGGGEWRIIPTSHYEPHMVFAEKTEVRREKCSLLRFTLRIRSTRVKVGSGGGEGGLNRGTGSM
jgi:hypothetical protein